MYKICKWYVVYKVLNKISIPKGSEKRNLSSNFDFSVFYKRCGRQGWASDGTGQSRIFYSLSRLSRGILSWPWLSRSFESRSPSWFQGSEGPRPGSRHCPRITAHTWWETKNLGQLFSFVKSVDLKRHPTLQIWIIFEFIVIEFWNCVFRTTQKLSSFNSDDELTGLGLSYHRTLLVNFQKKLEFATGYENIQFLTKL